MTPIKYVALGRGPLKPYLWLNVTGPSGNQRILGLLDTGADHTCLPEAYVGLLGYKHESLMPTSVAGVSGERTFQLALVPATAYIEGLEETTFGLEPLFGSPQPLWGRDVMEHFVVTLDQGNKTLTVIPN